MEQIKPNHSGGANFDARTVKDIIEPAKSISNKVSVKAALDEMEARAVDSSLVIDQRGELLGTVSKNEMNRKVGGWGHDPKTEPVEVRRGTFPTKGLAESSTRLAATVALCCLFAGLWFGVSTYHAPRPSYPYYDTQKPVPTWSEPTPLEGNRDRGGEQR